MLTTDCFLKFAAESMAKMSHSREGKATWNSLAQRWIKVAERLDASPQLLGSSRRRSNSSRKAAAG
jgi:hypothetical protein